MSESPLQQILQLQRNAFLEQGAPSYETRIQRVDRCIELLVDNQDEICRVIDADFGCRPRAATLMMDVMTSVNDAKHVKKHLKKWMKPEKRRANFPFGLLGAKAMVHYQPKGVVGIMTPWNVPVNMIFTPLVEALGAGNRCMIKPTEFTERTSALMEELLGRYFDASEVAVCNGGAEVGKAFSELPLDHIIFTGATSIGRHVMRAAAENLTPVTLELGGKSPVIVSSSVDLDDCIDKLIAGKMLNGGQICVSPDYCLVPDAMVDDFVARSKAKVGEYFPTIRDNPDYTAMINQRHYDRVQGYVNEARERGAKVVECNPAQEDLAGQSALKIPLQIVLNPPEDTAIMQDEIFGTAMVVRGYGALDEAIRYVNSRPRPLAMYFFGKDSHEAERVIADTIAGGMSINEVAMHLAHEDLPFGGVGDSGIGSYHGFEGFKTFSHAKSVFKAGFLNLTKVGGMLPPYGPKVDKILAGQIKK